ncbi:MAG TPA: hypothetical protein VFK13_01260 [Gemmatimonadaceae bacterium]|nr:hypothetical protein [Gemmatimonadaceae bacterium]
MIRTSRLRVVIGCALPMLLTMAATPRMARAQLRPLEPLDWRWMDQPAAAYASVGASVLDDQRASLLGAEGRLNEIGSFTLAVRVSSVVLEFGGTPVLRFDPDRVFAGPTGGADAPDGSTVNTAGQFRAATVVPLMRNPEERAFAMALRFGTQLPTTDNRAGLERDRLDFFATVSSRWRPGWHTGQAGAPRVALSAELGVGINGTRDDVREQSDVLEYALRARGGLGRVGSVPLEGTLTWLGQADGRIGKTPIRGNERLSELRLGVRGGDARWVEVEGVAGVKEFSPDWGVRLTVGMAWRRVREAH